MKRFKFLKSLKFRFFLVLVLIGIVPCIVLRGGLLKTYENKAVSNRSIDILSQAKILGNKIVTYDYLNNSSSGTISSQLDLISTIYDGRVMVINSSFQIVKDTYNMDTGKTIISEEVVKSFKGEEISKYDSENRYIEMTIPLIDSNTREISGVMLVSVSTDSIMANYEYLEGNAKVLEIAMGIVIIVLAAFCSIRFSIGTFFRSVYSSP